MHVVAAVDTCTVLYYYLYIATVDLARILGYDSQIVTSGGGVTRQTVEEGVGQVT